MIKRSFIFFFPLMLLGCGLTQQEQVDYSSVQQSGASPAIYDKMVHGDPLSVSDICALGHARVNEGVIIRYMRSNGTIYNLNASQIDRLRHAGISDSVIDYMLQTPQTIPPPVIIYSSIYDDPFCGSPYYGGGYHHWR